MVLVLNLFPLEDTNSCNASSNSMNIAHYPMGYDGSHFLCLIIPFRDRFDELNEFVPIIHDYLNRQGIAHAIFVINQIDTLRFNRASLINVGFIQSTQVLQDINVSDCDYVALHDVDLVPLNPDLSYAYPLKGPFHVAAPGLHPKYDYPSFLGAILTISREHFQLVNGMSNRYWGWGLEDDEFHRRLIDSGLIVQRPMNITTGKQDTFRHFHSPRTRKRDMIKCYNQHEVTRKRDRETGLDTVQYKLGRVYNNCVDSVGYTLINVVLQCDRNKTPWCDCKDAPKLEKPKNLPRDEDVIVPIISKKPRNSL